MTLCVAGNVDPERVKEVAEKYFTLKKNECISPDPVTEEKGVSNISFWIMEKTGQ